MKSNILKIEDKEFKRIDDIVYNVLVSNTLSYENESQTFSYLIYSLTENNYIVYYCGKITTNYKTISDSNFYRFYVQMKKFFNGEVIYYKDFELI